ncbi:peptide deformylase [Microbacterium sp. zg.Y1090]|uniref:peptide deformylase n=1 Tax=Microbacterium TaxID=33882 RepID=UPI00214ADF37|nr:MULTISPECIES: peptide deformylase [unclassified Microbacterium]MCR2811418.1 peptide deformylase [Microbacterium sp. zg.Y1084]MCR2819164.1 peptide deformylase [Microbacterium sp. zg.Y1090]MDL5487837.1 peptide deformylase [Microbacterium sp. zg-Y1211]WIM27463.1 peptide deformylase [Microbacterium sp. zg-Y1090]
MAVRDIRLFGDPVLRSSCAPIGDIDDGVRALVKDLLDTVELPGRAGVAANQIGVGLRAFSYNIDGDIGYVLNPRLVEVSGEPVPMGEGCLSVPGLWHDAIRYPHAKVVGIDLDGDEVVLEGDGLLAQALQHETDHLDGKVYLERLTPEDRRIAMREVRESAWF